jgi:hypothetical protein
MLVLAKHAMHSGELDLLQEMKVRQRVKRYSTFIGAMSRHHQQAWQANCRGGPSPDRCWEVRAGVPYMIRRRAPSTQQ